MTAAREAIEDMMTAVSVRVGWTRTEVANLSCRKLLNTFKTLYPKEAE
jgi:hypothetical protein